MKAFRIATTLYLFLLPLSSMKIATQEGFQSLIQGIREYIRTKNPPLNLTAIVRKLQLPKLFRNEIEKPPNEPQICQLCNIVSEVVIVERRNGISRDTLAQIAEYLCTCLGLTTRRVCVGLVELNIDPILYILDNRANVTPNRICGLVFQNLGCPNGDVFEWSISLPGGSSPQRSKPEGTTPGFKILQLTDVHYDPGYTPGGNAKSGEPISCQEDQGTPQSQNEACGYWTDYRDADVPWYLVEDTIRQVNTQELAYVYYTGDIMNHRIWDTSVANNTKTISQFYSFLKDRFQVPVYPVFGNHETQPINLWPPLNVTDETLSMRWLFELAADSWSDLVGEDIRDTVLKGGYYTVSPRPGFRIVAINSNVCYCYNWWLTFDDRDPYGQLQWLADTLKQAEDDHESVHILSHVPTGTAESLSVWGREYSRIVDRFANTITGQFNGHTHTDEFYVYYNRSERSEPVGVAFNGAALTPYSLANPSYKVYDVEAAMFTLRDYEEWTFNLTFANSRGSSQKPDWYRLYSFVEAYGVESLEAVEVDKVVYKMAEDHSLLDDYFKFQYRDGDAANARGCGEDCQMSNLCQMATTVFGEDQQCKWFLELYGQY